MDASSIWRTALSSGLLFGALLAIACSCARDSASGPVLTHSPGEAIELPGIESLRGQVPPRGASLTPEALVLSGSSFEDALPKNRLSPDGLLGSFSPNSGGLPDQLSELSYGIWRFDIADYEGPWKLNLKWSGTAPDEDFVWLAVADFGSGRWKWFEWTPATQIDFSSVENALNPTGQLFVALVVGGEESAHLERMRVGDLILSGELEIQRNIYFGPSSPTLDASSLALNGAAILRYEWDLDGNGSFEEDGGTDPMLIASLNPPLDILISVRITSDEGLRVATGRRIQVLNGNWIVINLSTATDPANTLITPRISITGGLPSVAWMRLRDVDEVTQETSIRFVQALSLGAHEWGSIRTAVSEAQVPYDFSELVDVNGRAALSFTTRDIPSSVAYVRADTASGSSWPSPQVLADDVSSENCALCLFGSKPVVAYHFDDGLVPGPQLRLLVAADSSGSSWGPERVAASNAGSGVRTGVTSGYMNVSFTHSSDGDLLFSASASPDMDWDVPEYQVAGGTSQQFIGLPFVQVMSYLHGTQATYITQDPFTPGVPEVYEPLADAVSAMASSTGVFSEHVTTCYVRQDDGTLNIAHFEFSDTLEFVVGEPVDTSPDLECNSCSLTALDGLPLIVYSDFNSRSIKFATMR